MIPAAILTDIEGTTSSIAFVHEVLFPYSRSRLGDYVREHAGELGDLLAAVRAEAGAALDLDSCVALLERWYDEDRKIAPLKTLQGLIWAQGYAAGVLKGHVYPDVAAALRQWHAAGIALYVYSSGSVGAQRLLFGHSMAGDINPLFAGNFDTAVGGKREAASYRGIAAAIALPAERILFLSDIAQELAAAQEAGMAVTQLLRDGAAPDHVAWPVATSFREILIEAAT